MDYHNSARRRRRDAGASADKEAGLLQPKAIRTSDGSNPLSQRLSAGTGGSDLEADADEADLGGLLRDRRRPVLPAERSALLNNQKQSLGARLGHLGEALVEQVASVLPPGDGDADEGAAASLADGDAENAASDGDGQNPDAPEPPDPAASSGVAQPIRCADVQDTARLFGDVSDVAKTVAQRHFFEIVIFGWALHYLIPQAAVTALLYLLHGLFGKELGVSSHVLDRGGGVPKKAQPLYNNARKLHDETHVDLFRRVKVPIPEDPAIRHRTGKPYVDVEVAVDLAHSIAAKLMDADLNNAEIPFLHQERPELPPEFVSASTCYSDTARKYREERLLLAQTFLTADATAAGIDHRRVKIVPVGVSWWHDSAAPLKTASYHAFMLSISALHPAVAHRPGAVVLGGHWQVPSALSRDKVGDADIGLHASSATKARLALLEQQIHKVAIADPLHLLFTRKTLFVRSASLHLGDTFSHQVSRRGSRGALGTSSPYGLPLRGMPAVRRPRVLS
jgi:hypothetical protein